MMSLIRRRENKVYHKEWLNFINCGELTQNVNPVIAASWQRCRASGLDPRGHNIPHLRSPHLRDDLKTRSLPLLEASRSSLRNLEESIGRISSVILLTDAAGNILFYTGSGGVGKYFAELGIVAGASDSEELLGTTALALSLHEQKPVTVLGEEHYSELYHRLCCASSPIFDSEGALAGGINIAVSVEDESKVPLLLGLSLNTVRCVQAEFHAVGFLAKLNKVNSLTYSIVECMDHGVILFDPIGNIIQANRKAGSILLGSGQHTVSKNYHELIKTELPAACCSTEVIADGRVTLLQGRNGRAKCMVRTKLLRDDSGQLLGSMAVLEDNKKQWAGWQDRASSAGFSLHDVVGESSGMKRAVRLAQRFGVNDVPILLYGETGTGKELFAHAIHNLSYRRNGPFVPLNCAAIPSGLVESELFGYVPGAFTGAAREGKKGKFEIASGGTLFLDEINSMPVELQAKLLRVIESNEIVMLGDHCCRSVDVRLLAAVGVGADTSEPDANLRKDLFYRISSVRIFLPPLRNRIEDIESLAYVFLKLAASKHQRATRTIDPAAMAILKAHNWPGNVRELKSAIEFAVCLADSDSLRPDDLPDHISGLAPEFQRGPMSDSGVSESTEKLTVQKVLDEHHGNKTLAAQAMGLSRTTFYRKRKKYNLLPLLGKSE